ncbi:alpha/beta fold hydrolase [Symbioplanes lichenis]|uniref:alpha/beta fold hydrolase n=1 Tax=Symbioplanes lichenis TaxID=1629072 RepID=UPI0034DADF92
MPGFGFSGKSGSTGWDVTRIAGAWITLMRRLGYDSWFAQGGDWGAAVAEQLTRLAPDPIRGVHFTMPLVFPTPQEMSEATAEEQRIMTRAQRYLGELDAYAREQATRPPDDRLFARRLPGPAGRLDLHPLPGRHRQQRPPRKGRRPRRDPRRHHALLAVQRGRLRRTPLLGGQAEPGPGPEPSGAQPGARRVQHLPRRGRPGVPALDRAALPGCGALCAARSRRPLRRPGTARLLTDQIRTTFRSLRSA